MATKPKKPRLTAAQKVDAAIADHYARIERATKPMLRALAQSLMLHAINRTGAAGEADGAKDHRGDGGTLGLNILSALPVELVADWFTGNAATFIHTYRDPADTNRPASRPHIHDIMFVAEEQEPGEKPKYGGLCRWVGVAEGVRLDAGLLTIEQIRVGPEGDQLGRLAGKNLKWRVARD